MTKVRKITIFLHCYGASVIAYLEQMMKTEMRAAGYAPDEIAAIQKNMLVIAHTPAAPIDHSAFTFISFASAKDNRINYFNNFNRYASAHANELKPSFFPDPSGNLFAARRFKRTESVEHGLMGLPFSESDILTDDGYIIFSAERNVLINGVKSSETGTPLPSIKELATGSGVNFDELVKNGETFMKNMVADLRRQKNPVKNPGKEK